MIQGNVYDHSERYWHIRYQDDDWEGFTLREMKQLVKKEVHIGVARKISSKVADIYR